LSLANDLGAIEALTGTGLARRTGTDTWSLDTTAYLSSNQTITLSGDATGSGTTAITVTLNTVPISKGGTGQTTAPNAINALLPTQTTAANSFLRTNGTNLTWTSISDYVGVINVATSFNAIPDAVRVLDGRIAQNSSTLTSQSAVFTINDIGKSIKVYNVDLWQFGIRTTIIGVIDSHTIQLADQSTVDMLAGQVMVTWGTDNTTAIQNALTYAASIVSGLDINVNNPIGTGIASVKLPTTKDGSMYLVSAPITIPRNVCLGGDAMIYNNISNFGTDIEFPIVVADGGSLSKVLVDCAHGCGITCGTTTGNAHSRLEHIRLWNVGTDVGQRGLVLKGFDYDIGHVWIKGGNIALDMDTASDCHFNTVYIMGAQTPIRLNGCQNINFNKIVLDTNAAVGVMIDTSHHIDANVMSFNNYDGTLGTILQVGVQIGSFTGTKCSNINIKYHAAQTGGVGLAISNAEDCSIDMVLSNALLFSNTTGGVSFTSAVTYGTGLSKNINITVDCPAALSTSGSVYTGTRYGNLSITSDTVIANLTNSNIGFGTTSQFGGGLGVIAQSNATTIPTTSPTNGYVQYSESGVPKFKFADGTVVSLATLATAGSSTITSENKVVVLFGSSTIAGVGSSNWAGTPNNGANPVSSTSWGGLLMSYLSSTYGYTCYNQSIGGTYSQTSLDRFYADVAPKKPAFVIIGTSIWNEPNITTDPAGAIAIFLANTYELIRRVEQLGAVPILIGQYSSWMTTTTLYGLVKSLDTILEKLVPMTFDFLNQSDDGTGTWLSALTVDYTHPNDSGHALFYNAVPTSFFAYAGPYRKSVSSIKRGRWALSASDTTLWPMSATIGNCSNWSVRIKVQSNTPQTARAYLSIGVGATGYFRVRNPSTTLVLTDSQNNADLLTSGVTIGDGVVHDIVVTYNTTTNKVRMYIDGSAIGSGATPSFAVTSMTTFVVGGKHDVGTSNGVDHIYSDFTIWRTCLNASDVAEMYLIDRVPLKSLEVLASMSHTPQTTYAENVAMTTILLSSPGIWSRYADSIPTTTQTALGTKYDKTGGIISSIWNSGATTFTGVTLNFTDTASSATSLLLDAQISGTSKFKIKKSGEITVAGIDIGFGAGSVTSNLSIGSGTMTSVATGTGHTVIGNSAGALLTTALTNTAVGNSSMAVTTTGSSNTAVGANTLLANTTGFQNTAIGKDALKVNTIGNQSTALGNSSLIAATTGNNNTAFGFQSLLGVTTGSNNLGFGYQAGNGITTASFNVVIGSYTASITTSNNVYIADGQGNIRLRVPSTGNLLVNTIVDIPSSKLTVASTTQGSLPLPQMSTTQRDAIASPADGIMIWNATTQEINVYRGGAVNAWYTIAMVVG
jgi:lysophospholipase L1-like esterase